LLASAACSQIGPSITARNPELTDWRCSEMKRIGLIVITALLFFWLSACGGSSSNSSSNTNPATGGSSPAAGAQNPGTGSGGTSSGGSSTSALAYVAGSNQSFFGIRVDSSSNISTVSGSPYSLSGNLFGLAATGNLLFASSVSSDFSTASITSYSADANGALTQVATTPVGSSGGARIALDSTGKFLYGTAQASNNGGTIPAIFGFSVDQNSGKLTSLAGSPWRITQASDASSASNPAVTANGAWLCLNMSLARTNEAAQCYARHADGTIEPNNFVQSAVSNTGITGLALTSDSTHLLYSEGASNFIARERRIKCSPARSAAPGTAAQFPARVHCPRASLSIPADTGLLWSITTPTMSRYSP